MGYLSPNIRPAHGPEHQRWFGPPMLWLMLLYYLVGCEGGVYLRTCDTGFVERRFEGGYSYYRDQDGFRFQVAASAIAFPATASRIVPFSFTLVIYNTGPDTLYYSSSDVALTSLNEKIPIEYFWSRDFKTFREVTLQRDTTIMVLRGDSTNLRFVTERGDPNKSWDKVWLKPGRIRSSGRETAVVLDSACLRLMRKGIDY